MSMGRRFVAWAAAVLAVTALVSCLVFFAQGFTRWYFMDQAWLTRVLMLFAVSGVLACGLAALPRKSSAAGQDVPAWVRLPEGRLARAAHEVTLLFFLLVYLFVSDTLLRVFVLLRVPEGARAPVFQLLERLAPWSIAAAALAGLALGLAAWRKPRGRGLVLVLPLLPALLVAGFLLSQVLGPD